MYYIGEKYYFYNWVTHTQLSGIIYQTLKRKKISRPTITKVLILSEHYS